MAVSPAVIIICLPCSYHTSSQTPTDWSVCLTEARAVFEIVWVPFVKKGKPKEAFRFALLLFFSKSEKSLVLKMTFYCVIPASSELIFVAHYRCLVIMTSTQQRKGQAWWHNSAYHTFCLLRFNSVWFSFCNLTASFIINSSTCHLLYTASL